MARKWGNSSSKVLTGNSGSNFLIGHGGDDRLSGLGGADFLYGNKGSDTLDGGSGNDFLFGGQGFDTAVFHGLSMDYSITALGYGAFRVRDLNQTDGNDGTDIVRGIEQLRFSDRTIDPGAPPPPPPPAADQQFVFSAYDPEHGRELWVTDGTSAGTRLVKDLNPGTGDSFQFSYPGDFGRLDDRHILFGASGDANGPNTQLWVTDGTEAGTRLVRNIGLDDQVDPRSFVSLHDGRAVFLGSDEATGREWWVSDGTASGTFLLKDIEPGIDGSFPNASAVSSFGVGQAFFAFRTQLWITDGTSAGTKVILDLDDGSRDRFVDRPTDIGSGLAVFRANDAEHGTELWITDGTAAGTHLVADIQPGPDWGNPYNITAMGDGRFLFNGTGADTGSELWISDGTAAGTHLVREIWPGLNYGDPSYTTPTLKFTALGNGQFLFVANDPVHGREVWATDGTADGTYLLKETRPGPADGEANFIVPIGGGKALFSAFMPQNQIELWVTDGTEAGTHLVKDILPGEASSNVIVWTATNDGRALIVATGPDGTEPWISDGTAEGTYQLADINPGIDGSVTGGFHLI